MAVAVKTKKLNLPQYNAVSRAVRVTFKNTEKLAEWIRERGGQAEAVPETDPRNFLKGRRVRVKTTKGWRVARIGDVILLGSERHIFGVYKQEDFLHHGGWNA